MCGISVLVRKKSGTNNRSQQIFMMNTTIQHRGPDDEGYVFFSDVIPGKPLVFGGPDTPSQIYSAHLPYTPLKKYDSSIPIDSLVVLAHRRLSIIDLSPGGHQPMCYDNQRYWITYNGEIYNWKELRQELETLGHKFISQSDTEVILAAYVQWGKDCLHRFNGMWAFVILDQQTGTIFVSRDRFGVKPLYYWYSPEGYVAFASEIKQFTVLPGWQAFLNEERAFEFLYSDLMDHTSETLFSGVFQLRGGEAAYFKIEDISTKLPVYQWYELGWEDFKGTFFEASNKLRDLLTDSVRMRLRADVHVGSCLSGGLDSSSIVCLVNKIREKEIIPGNQMTFSSCSEIKKFDEREYIDEVVKKNCNIKAYYTYPSLKVLCDNLDKIIWHQDEPFSTTSIFAQWQVFQLASQNDVKVMLDGQGADEQLCGYHIFFSLRQADLFKKLKWGTMVSEIINVRKIHRKPIRNSIFEIVTSFLPSKWKYLFITFLNPKSISSFWVNARQIKKTPEIILFPELNASSSIKKESYRELIFTSLPMLLHWEDRDSMAHSVESRVPFLDYRVVEFIFSLPDEFKIRRETTKIILRESLKRILPEKIRIRSDKMGFGTAEEYWVTVENPKIFRQLLNDSIEISQGIIKKDALIQLNDMIEGKVPYSFVIWRLICFGRWMKIFNIKINDENRS